MIPIYIGTYTDGASKGIYRLELDRAMTQLSTPVLVAEAVNPSFLAWHPSHAASPKRRIRVLLGDACGRRFAADIPVLVSCPSDPLQGVWQAPSVND